MEPTRPRRVLAASVVSPPWVASKTSSFATSVWNAANVATKRPLAMSERRPPSKLVTSEYGEPGVHGGTAELGRPVSFGVGELHKVRLCASSDRKPSPAETTGVISGRISYATLTLGPGATPVTPRTAPGNAP